MTVPMQRPTGPPSDRERALRRALDRERDPATRRLLLQWIDDEFTARAHVRAADPIIRRYRRLALEDQRKTSR